MKWACILLIVPLLVGCGTLIPKRVEFGQDKVRAFPEPRAAEKETQREVARLAADKAQETLKAAITADSPASVVLPADETVTLTGAVAESVGAPLSALPIDTEAREAAADLRRAVAKLNKRMDEFKEDNNENTGKKIEGTGWLSVPYFLWIALVGVFLFAGLIVAGVVWHMVKMYATVNPPLQLGVGAVQMGAGFAKKALSQLAAGGEAFKTALEKEVSDPALLNRIKDIFRTAHQTEQDGDVQAVVRQITS